MGYSESVVELSSEAYQESIPAGAASFISLPVTSFMQGPIYVYYELSNFYQNHRRYVKSRDDNQLSAGNSVLTASDAYSTNCDPWYEVDLPTTSMQLYPCGLVARSVFNDTFSVSVQRSGSTSIEQITMDETPDTISWSQDVSKKFKQANPSFITNDRPLMEQLDMWLLYTFPPQICAPISPTTAPRLFEVASKTTLDGLKIVDCDFNLESPTCNFSPPCVADFAPVPNPSGWGINSGHFINWMRTAGLSTFRKLYGKIDGSFQPGDVVRIGVQSKFPVSSYDGTKRVVLSTVTWAGGKNSFLGIGYIVVGGLSLLFTAVYATLHLKRPRRLVDIDYLDWGDHN